MDWLNFRTVKRLKTIAIYRWTSLPVMTLWVAQLKQIYRLSVYKKSKKNNTWSIRRLANRPSEFTLNWRISSLIVKIVCTSILWPIFTCKIEEVTDCLHAFFYQLRSDHDDISKINCTAMPWPTLAFNRWKEYSNVILHCFIDEDIMYVLKMHKQLQNLESLSTNLCY